MSDPNNRNTSGNDRNAARSKAQERFVAAEKRNTDVLQEIARQQAATAARTATLRALRLAKEEADRATAAPPPPPKPIKKRAR